MGMLLDKKDPVIVNVLQSSAVQIAKSPWLAPKEPWIKTAKTVVHLKEQELIAHVLAHKGSLDLIARMM